MWKIKAEFYCPSLLTSPSIAASYFDDIIADYIIWIV